MSQSRPAFVAVWPINRQAVALKAMEPVHLFSLAGPNRVKRVGIHVFVHPKVQLLQDKLMPPDARSICPHQGGFKGSDPTNVRRPIQSIEGFYGRSEGAIHPNGVGRWDGESLETVLGLEPQHGKRWRNAIGFVHPSTQWIQRVLGRGVSDFKMQMRTATPPRIPAPSQGVPGFHPKHILSRRRGIQPQRTALVRLIHCPILNVRGKGLEMGVHRKQIVWPLQVQGVAIAPRRHFDTRHPPLGGCQNRQPFPAHGLQIHPCMKMVAAQLPEVATEQKRHPQRSLPIVLLLEAFGAAQCF